MTPEVGASANSTPPLLYLGQKGSQGIDDDFMVIYLDDEDDSQLVFFANPDQFGLDVAAPDVSSVGPVIGDT